MMRAWAISLSFLLLPVLGAYAAEKAAYDSNGRIISVFSSGEDLPVASSVVAVLPSGRRVALQVRRASGNTSEGAVRRGDALAWSVPFTLPDGDRGHIDVHSTEDSSSVRYAVTVTAETN
jgi:hypothetical protein